MSGGGGSGGSPREPELTCDEIEFKTVLASPNPEIVEELSVGEWLDIEIYQEKIVVKKDDSIVGSIIEKVPSLLRCIQEGHSYRAKIIGVNDGRVEILVKNTFSLGS